MNKLRVSALFVLTAGLLAMPSAALASNDYTSPTTVVVNTPPTSAHVLGEVIRPAAVVTDPAPLHRSLPFTGGDVAGLVVGGVVLLGAGTILVRRNRSIASQR